MDCADKQKRELRFGAEYSPREDFSISAHLTSKEGKPLGIEVVFSKEFVRSSAKAFVRLKKNFSESAIEAGVTIPW